MKKQNKYRKALKNYTSGRRIDKMVGDIQRILAAAGAKGVGFSYDDQGMIEGVHFQMVVNEQSQVINLPFRRENVAEVLKKQGFYKDDDQSYRVAVANILDWLDAQMALLATEMVEFPEIFLPYMASKDGRTLYEIAKNNQFLLAEKSS
jgi:microsomal dipeptidase-like Zn-dependent dipeptidase